MGHAMRRAASQLASSFSPLTLSGLKGWWDASDTATITSAATLVSQITDKSGVGNHLLQSVDANKPKTGTRTQNGLNVLDFDGNDLVACDIANISQPWTVYVMHASDNPGSGQYQFWGQWASGKSTFYIDVDVYRMYGGSAVVASSITETSGFRFAAAVFNGASSKGYVDGSTFTGSPGAGACEGVNLGSFSGAVGLDGVIGEAILCSAAHDDATVAQVRTYAQAKWGTA